MNAKGFVLLLVIVLLVGGGLGGAVVGVVALSKSEGDKAAQSSIPTPAASNFQQQPSGQTDAPSLDELRDRFASGDLTQEGLAELRQQFQGQFGQGESRQGFAGGPRLIGTIEKVEGNTVTVNTVQGPLQALTGPDTTVQMSAEGTLADLQVGVQVRVIGQRGEDGAVVASSISILSEGEAGFPTGGFLGRFGQDPDAQGQFGQGPARQGFAGGTGLTGAIENIEGNTVTVNTSQGPLQADISADTTIQLSAEGTLADLQSGLRVTVSGQTREDGIVEANTIILIPEGAEGFPGSGFPGRRGLPGGEPEGSP